MSVDRKIQITLWAACALLALACSMEPIGLVAPEKAEAGIKENKMLAGFGDPNPAPPATDRRIFPPCQITVIVPPSDPGSMFGTRIVTGALTEITDDYLVVIHEQWPEAGICGECEMIWWMDVAPNGAWLYQSGEEIVRPD